MLFRTYVGSFITKLKPKQDVAKSILENSKVVMLFLYQPFDLELKLHNATIRKFKAFKRIFPIHLFWLTWRSIKTNEVRVLLPIITSKFCTFLKIQNLLNFHRQEIIKVKTHNLVFSIWRLVPLTKFQLGISKLQSFEGFSESKKFLERQIMSNLCK